jgi:hypothetical protein
MIVAWTSERGGFEEEESELSDPPNGLSNAESKKN